MGLEGRTDGWLHTHTITRFTTDIGPVMNNNFLMMADFARHEEGKITTNWS